MKTILITGATDGIGLATAMELAVRGHELVLLGQCGIYAPGVRD
jgi:short-subunit dehydrogenase